MRPRTHPSVSLTLGLALVGLALLWLRPRPVYELWTAQELEAGQGIRVAALERLARTEPDPAAAPRLFVVDLDSDGDDDLVQLDHDGMLATAYRNRGRAGPARMTPAQITGADSSLARLGARRGGRGLTWEEARAEDGNVSSAPPSWAEKALFFDADGDGDLDAIVAEMDAEAPLRFYMLLDAGYREISERLGAAWTTPRGIVDLACGDLDADGLLDVTLARPGLPPVVLWNRFARP